METVRYKSIIVFLTLLVATPSSGASDRNLTILTSSDSEFRFVCSFESELDALSPGVDSLSLAALERIIQVALPPGAEARLISVSGRRERIDMGRAISLQPSAGQPGLASVSRPVTVRGRSTVGVRVSPIEAGAVYNDVEVHLAFNRTRPATGLTTANDPVFERVWSASLANYRVARNWPILDHRRSESQTSMAAGAVSAIAPGRWYQVIVTNTGLVRVTGAQLEAAGIALGGLTSDSIRVFNAGGLPNSIDNTDPRPQFEEISLLVLDGGDGIFDRGDQLLFYGEAPGRWVYRAGEMPEYVNNRYTDENVYWLSVSGSFLGPAVRMQQVNGEPSGPSVPVVDSHRSRVHVEQDNIISVEADGHVWDFYNWYWTDETSLTTYVSTPGAVEADSAYIYVSGRTNRSIDLTINGTASSRINCHSSACQHYSYSLLGGVSDINRIDLLLAPITSTIPPFLNYLQISYRAHLLPLNNRIDFNLEGVDGEVEVKVVDNFSAVPTVFDISDPLHPVIFTGFERSDGYLSFRAVTTSAGPNRFRCEVIGQAASPARIEAVDVIDLRTGFDQTDMIIVTTGSLAPYLDQYIAYREGRGWAIQTVLVDDIMDNFSYGLYDPTAIRDFLKFAYESYPAPAPATVLFVGDATYDYHDHLGTGMLNFVPSFIRPGDRTYSDDNYVYFGDFGILDSDRDRGYDMMTARWPVRSASEINTIVNKIILYESPSSFGSWRTRITLVADDEHTTDRHDEIFHTIQTEMLEKDHVPRLLNRHKIYLWEYPFVNREKPDVNDAIVDAFNKGSLVINYVGHGNPDVWSHEHVLQRGGDLPRLKNAGRLPLVYAASCDIGFFDNPRREGMAEDLLALASGGAIGVISATRLVYAADNAQFNRVVFDKLFGNPDLSIGEAMFAAKIERQYSSPLDTIPQRVDNDRAYNFLGDPCLRLALPRLRLQFSQRPDTLVAAGVSRVSGRVVDENGSPVNADGVLQISVYDADREMNYRLPDDSAVAYYVAGPTIYRGTASITGGNFDFQFVTPLDVSYRGSSARLSTYARLSQIDGIGLVDSLVVSEAQNEVEDIDGPVITFTVSGRRNFVEGDMLSRDESLNITIFDASGVNLVGGIGHGIVLVLDDNIENSINLTDLFEYDRDDYTSGNLVFPLAEIAPGRHQFKIKAWDNVNNVSIVEFAAEIAEDNRLAVHDLLNYPNPMHEKTTFYFALSQPVAELRVGIYTLSGKNIWNAYRYQLGADNYPNGSVEIVWDGRDAEGDRVARGTYVYRLTARAESTGEDVEKFGKVVVLN